MIRFRIVFLIPHADSDRFSSVRGNQDQFVLKAFLLLKQWKDFVFQCHVKLCNDLGLQTHGIRKAKLARAYRRVRQAGAHYVVDGISDVSPVPDEINVRLAAGERP